jgi:CheY-specific phosphatase CheX
MFFQMVQVVETDSTLQEWLAQEHSLRGATLDFEGPLKGSFYIFIPDGAANKITAFFLGLNAEEVDEEQQKDTVKEALNMIGGGLLAILDQKGDFKLGIPQSIEPNDLALDKFDGLHESFVLFETEDNRLAAGIVVD